MKNKFLFLLFSIFFLTSFNIKAQNFWEVVPTPPDIGIHSIEVNSNGDLFLAWASSSVNGVLRKLSYEDTWDTALNVMSDVVGKIYIDSFDNIFAASTFLNFSEDNGENWRILDIPPSFGGIRSILHSSDEYVFIGSWGGICKSESVDSNFIQVLLLQDWELVNAMVEDAVSGILYAGTINPEGGGGVYRSVDKGDNWEHIGLIDRTISSLALSSTGDLFAGSLSSYLGGVYKLPLGQTDWINLNDEEIVNSVVINLEDEIYIGCSSPGGVRCSNDYGQTWEITNSGMGNQEVTHLILGSDGYLFACQGNAYVYQSVNSTITGINPNTKENNILSYNYPNPFYIETTINYSLSFEQPNQVQVIITNSQGQIINTNILPDCLGDQQSIKFSAGTLPAGYYYYHLIAGNVRTSGKMVLLK